MASFSRLIGLGVLLARLATAQTSCAAQYNQCGGIGYTGVTCCQGGASCSTINPYYYQCIPASTTSGGSGGGSTSLPPGSSYATSTTLNTGSTATQVPYPAANASDCGAWELLDNVCCPDYCLSNNESSSCSPCSGACGFSNSSFCKSGTMWGETFTLTTGAEDWHYSRSTHFGLTPGGACGFGLYGLCTSAPDSWIQADIKSTCSAFCTAYPTLCQDPSNSTLRGNFAAPNGDYYTQFWPSLAADGNPDNYLSCGECFEMVITKPDGTLYTPGEAGYTPPILLEIVDSCPCSANPKWCCGPGADHCGEIDFTYGCPLPEGSHHMDLSDIAMGRLQGNGSLSQGVIPTQYRRVSCPNPGNAYIWFQAGAGPYYFALSVVNTRGLGSVVLVEALSSGSTEWIALERNPDYTEARPQERYGVWTLPQGQGPMSLPMGLRVTAPDGSQIVNTEVITVWNAPATAPSGYWYIDLGMNFN